MQLDRTIDSTTLNTDKKDVWMFWYYEWVENGFPESAYSIYYEGPLMKIHSNPKEFLKDKVYPGLALGYITMEEEKLTTESHAKVVTVYLEPEQLIKRMTEKLSLEVAVDHMMAMEEAGWEFH